MGFLDRMFDRRQDVDLRRHVERSGWLVEDDQFGMEQSAIAVIAR